MADLDKQIEQLKKCEYIKESEVKALCERAKEILLQEDNVVKVEAPITVSTLIRPFEFSYSDLWRHSRVVL